MAAASVAASTVSVTTAMVAFPVVMVTTEVAVFMTTALMSFLMVMAGGAHGDQLSFQEGLDGLISIPGCTGDNSNPHLGEGILGPASDTAADQESHIVGGEDNSQSAMSLAIASDNLCGNDFTALDFIEFEEFGVSEMLVDVSIFISHCNNHLFLLSLQRPS